MASHCAVVRDGGSSRSIRHGQVSCNACKPNQNLLNLLDCRDFDSSSRSCDHVTCLFGHFGWSATQTSPSHFESNSCVFDIRPTGGSAQPPASFHSVPRLQ